MSISGARVLEVRDLHSFYGDAHVVQGASLGIAPREVVALLGRNGMGKTSTLRSIMALATPQVRAGTVIWKGETLTGLPPHAIARRKIGYVPQGRRLFPSLTVLEHLTLLKSPRVTNGWTVAKVFEIFPRLAERRGHGANQLSGGERQMLAIGRALMTDPELLLMDEPSEGLAPVMVRQLEEVIVRIKHDGLAILLVEQNLFTALAVADRVYIMESGRIVFEASAAAVSADPDAITSRLGVHT